MSGAYRAMAQPGQKGAPPPKVGQGMLGAIVESPSGLWFFKLTGPEATVKAARASFDAMLSSVHL
jgi:hypothetical protein